MRQHRQNRLQRALRPTRTSRQIHNQRLTQRPAHRSAQRSMRRMQQPVGAHPFRQPVDQPLANQLRRLRRHIPRGQPRPPRRHDQIYNFCVMPQRRGNQINLIRQCLARQHTSSSGLQNLTDSRPREVSLLSARAAVADRQHNRPDIRCETFTHPYSLKVWRTVQKLRR
jgi:hypothetical protein